MIIGNNNNTFTPKNNPHQSNVKFTGFIGNLGGKIPDKFLKLTELENDGSMTRHAFVSLAFIFLLGARYLQARSQDEKREVATRDFIGVVSAVYAVPELKKLIGGYIDKRSKIPAKLTSFKDLETRFSETDFSRRKNGLASMLTDIKELNGDLKTCLGVLGDKVNTPLAELSKKLKFEKQLDSNDNILELVTKAQDSAKTNAGVKESLETIQNAFGKDNALLKKANLLKSIPDATCILLTAAMLGFFIPWFNIQYTKKKYVGKDHEPKVQPAKIDKSI